MPSALPHTNAVQALLGRALAHRRLPITGNFELTWECNLRCDHCYLGSDRQKAELNTAEILTMIDQLAKAGTLMLTLTGGEVLLRRDFAQIYTHAHRAGFLLTVFTNGFLLRDKVLQLFSEAPPRAIEVSLYGLSDEDYQRFAHRNASFAKLDQNLRAARDLGLPMILKSVATTSLATRLPRMRQYAQSLAVGFRYASVVYDAHDNTTLAQGERPQASRVCQHETQLDGGNARQERAESAVHHQDARVFSCGAGRVSFNIDPEGNLSRCGMVQGPQARKVSLRAMPVEQAWERLGDGLEALHPHGHPCRTCSIRHLCSRCPATSNPQAQVDMCTLAYERAKGLGYDVSPPKPPMAAYLARTGVMHTNTLIQLPRRKAKPTAESCGS